MSKRMFIVVISLLLLQCTTVCAQGNAHLYAVLVNGGRNRLTNHERYWNDCAFLYRTLRHTYHLPKRNITVLMSDGNDPAVDMLQADGRGFKSSSLDLDGDGEPDVQYPARLHIVTDVLYSLARRLTADDHLFLFVIDHGGSNDKLADSFLWLWDDERLNDYELGWMLNLFHVATINVLMGQCYSGGFIADLAHDGRVMATACRGDEQSWVSPEGPYDEFVHHWTCAINGADENGMRVNADTNGDGLVSMAEAFEYAHSHDRVNETPQYASWPEQLGDQWTFGDANGGTVESREVKREEMNSEEPSAVWSVSGIRRQKVDVPAVSLERRGGKVIKKVRKR